MTDAELIAEKETARAQYVIARTAILSGGQSYSIGNRSLTRVDLEFIEATIDKLAADIRTLERGNKIMTYRVVPRDGL